MNAKESSKSSMIHALQKELAQEVDDHAKSEHELKQLESKIVTLQLELEKNVNQIKNVVEKNESLLDKLEDAEQATKELNNTITDKNHTISLLKEQVKLSQKNTSKHHQAQSISSPPITLSSSSTQSVTAPVGINNIEGHF